MLAEGIMKELSRSEAVCKGFGCSQQCKYYTEAAENNIYQTNAVVKP